MVRQTLGHGAPRGTDGPPQCVGGIRRCRRWSEAGLVAPLPSPRHDTLVFSRLFPPPQDLPCAEALHTLFPLLRSPDQTPPIHPTPRSSSEKPTPAPPEEARPLSDARWELYLPSFQVGFAILVTGLFVE